MTSAGVASLVSSMRRKHTISSGPRLSSVPDIAEGSITTTGPGNPQPAIGPPDGGIEEGKALRLEMLGPMCRPEAIEGMADELCRFAKEFKRRVAARKLLPALASLSAVGPLHELLNQQLGSSLMAESVRVQDSSEVPDGPGDLPGYL